MDGFDVKKSPAPFSSLVTVVLYKATHITNMPQNTVHGRILHDTGTLKTAVKRMLQWACRMWCLQQTKHLSCMSYVLMHTRGCSYTSNF